jgi:hypothetical protein
MDHPIRPYYLLLIARKGPWLEALCNIGHFLLLLLFTSIGLYLSLVFLLFIVFSVVICFVVVVFFFAALVAGSWATMYIIFTTLGVGFGVLLCNHFGFLSFRLSRNIPLF